MNGAAAELVRAWSAHAIGIEGDAAFVEPMVRTHLETQGWIMAHNPDLMMAHFEVLGVEEVGRIRAFSATTATSAQGKVIVLLAQGITFEAQNALLKVLEEPPRGTRFVLSLPALSMLLPTVRSRLMEVVAAVQEREGFDSKSFITAAYAKRAEMLADIITKKDAYRARAAVEALMQAVKEDKVLVAKLETVRGYLMDRAPNVKMLLEYVIALIPKGK